MCGYADAIVLSIPPVLLPSLDRAADEDKPTCVATPPVSPAEVDVAYPPPPPPPGTSADELKCAGEPTEAPEGVLPS